MKNTAPEFFKIYLEIHSPTFLFLTFEDNLNDKFIIYDNQNVSLIQHDTLLFNEIKNNILQIDYIFADNFGILG